MNRPLSPMSATALASVILICLMGPAAADTGRYTMTQTKDGFLRLDTLTGSVSMCARKEAGWRCQTLADDKLALEKEITRLTKQNREMKRQLAGRGGRIGPGGQSKSFELPSEQDVDEAMNLVERMLKRFRGMVESMRKKEDAPGTPL